MKGENTSWGAVADWYDDLVEGSDSYQEKVVLPNLTRLVGAKKGITILDVACGQGYFARAFAAAGADVVASDVSAELIALAKEKNKAASKVGTITYYVAPSDALSFAKDSTANVVMIVLALQNIKKMSETILECGRVLKKGGRLIFILNHPAFRVPKASSWEWDEKLSKQYRRIDAYMSDSSITVDMNPGETDPKKKHSTVSFHRPLQAYFKALNKAGLSVTRFEEWISHRKSEEGPRGAEEDRMRKEIPLFLAIEATKS